MWAVPACVWSDRARGKRTGSANFAICGKGPGGWSRFQYRSLTASHVVDVGGEDVGEGGLAGEERKVAVDEVVVEVGVESPEVDIRQDRVVVGVVEIDESAHVVADDLMGVGWGGGGGVLIGVRWVG